jgi:hypothetical protein
LANADHRRHAPFAHVGQRGFARENRICIRELHPGVSEFRTIENVQRLKNADQERNTREFVLIERFGSAPFELIERAVRNAAEQVAGVFIAQFPVCGQAEEGAIRRWTALLDKSRGRSMATPGM